MQKLIDEAANNWERTKDPKYKKLWYKLIKDYANGPHSIKRWPVSSDTSDKTDDGRYSFSK